MARDYQALIIKTCEPVARQHPKYSADGLEALQARGHGIIITVMMEARGPVAQQHQKQGADGLEVLQARGHQVIITLMLKAFSGQQA